MSKDKIFELADVSLPGQPRKQVLCYSQRPMDPDVLAVVRLTWYLDHRPEDVTEFQIVDRGQHSFDQFVSTVTTAIQQGADVAIMSDCDPEEFGLEP